MPYCRECGYEYTPGITSCPDCQSPLAPGDRFTCDLCNELVSPDDLFCKHCGVILPWTLERDTPVHCDTHHAQEAIGACVVCKKTLCEECAVMKTGRFFCEKDERVKTAFNWVAACTTSTDYEAEMIKANLEGAGISAMVLSQKDHTYVTTVGDLAQTEVMVPRESLEEARRFIRSLESSPEDSVL